MRIDYEQLDHYHPLLKQLMRDLEDWLWFEPTMTSEYRPGMGGVHDTIPLRAIDVRCKDDSVGFAAEKYLNERWIYDPQRHDMDVCMYHDAGSGYHLHLQVHPRSIRDA